MIAQLGYLGLEVSDLGAWEAFATSVLGVAGAFESPATAALLPLIAPQGTLQRATAISSGATQVATITGPALGGLAYAVSPGLPYGIMVVFWLFPEIKVNMKPLDWKAPMSTPWAWFRLTPRWSAVPASEGSPAPRAGLPGSRAMVGVGPP